MPYNNIDINDDNDDVNITVIIAFFPGKLECICPWLQRTRGKCRIRRTRKWIWHCKLVIWLFLFVFLIFEFVNGTKGVGYIYIYIYTCGDTFVLLSNKPAENIP